MTLPSRQMERLCSQSHQQPRLLLNSRQHKVYENLVSRPKNLYTYITAITSKIAPILSATEIPSVPPLHFAHQYIIQPSFYTSNNEIEAQQPSIAVTHATKTGLSSKIPPCNKKFNAHRAPSPKCCLCNFDCCSGLEGWSSEGWFFY